MTQKGLAPILIVLILAALVGGYLVYQNQAKIIPPSPTTQPFPRPTDETANWKIYTNKDLGFSIKYPPDIFELKEKVNLNPQTKLSVDLKQVSSNVDYVEIFLDITTKSEEEIIQPISIYGPGKDKIVVDGIQVTRYSFYGGEAGSVYNEVVIIPRKGLNYYFHLGTYGQKDLLNNILSTFKFTN